MSLPEHIEKRIAAYDRARDLPDLLVHANPLDLEIFLLSDEIVADHFGTDAIAGNIDLLLRALKYEVEALGNAPERRYLDYEVAILAEERRLQSLRVQEAA